MIERKKRKRREGQLAVRPLLIYVCCYHRFRYASNSEVAHRGDGVSCVLAQRGKETDQVYILQVYMIE